MISGNVPAHPDTRICCQPVSQLEDAPLLRDQPSRPFHKVTFTADKAKNEASLASPDIQPRNDVD